MVLTLGLRVGRREGGGLFGGRRRTLLIEERLISRFVRWWYDLVQALTFVDQLWLIDSLIENIRSMHAGIDMNCTTYQHSS